MNNPKPLHFNVPQIKAILVDAFETYGVMSRGTGKSSGILSPWLLKQALSMPRSMGGIVGATFQQILVRTLPPMISNWERMGYHRDIHFVIGREPSESWKKMWNWQGPLVKPLDSKYAIYWFNGSVQVLISQDRIGSSNGLSLAYIGGDEAKLLKKDRLDDEIMPTLRGNRSHFGHYHGYRGKMFLTDMPSNKSGKWILEKASEMDVKRIELITIVQLRINQLEFDKQKAAKSYQDKIQQKINKLQAELTKLRQGSIYYAEANAYDNIDVLGEDYIKDMKRNLSDLNFRMSILNERIDKVDNGFYSLLDEELHGSDWFNYEFLDRYINEYEAPNDCRQDAYNHSAPLEVAFDYGAHINNIVVGQEIGREFRILNAMHVLAPQLVNDVVDKFCEYYKHHKNKTVIYWYDHTAVGKHGMTSYTYSAMVMEQFVKNGWRVVEEYIGLAPSHDRKYDFWHMLLKEEDSRLPAFRYSRTHCGYLELSMNNAGVKQGRNGFEKDKSAERDPKARQEEAPHYSDAVDTLLWGKYKGALENEMSFVPSSTM